MASSLAKNLPFTLGKNINSLFWNLGNEMAWIKIYKLFLPAPATGKLNSFRLNL